MTDMPPPRYRIVERGRRLEVIDTWHAGGPSTPRPGAAPPPPAAMPARGRMLPRFTTIKFDGTGDLTTAAWFDDKAPRIVRLPGDVVQPLWIGAALIVAVLVAVAFFFPALLLMLGALTGDKPRAAMRRRATDWIDRHAA